MGAVFNQADFISLQKLTELVHVHNVATHVRQEKHPRTAAVDLAFQIIEVDDQLVGRLDQNRVTARIVDRAWYG